MKCEYDFFFQQANIYERFSFSLYQTCFPGTQEKFPKLWEEEEEKTSSKMVSCLRVSFPEQQAFLPCSVSHIGGKIQNDAKYIFLEY